MKSNIDIDKLDKVPTGHPFEYKDVVRDGYPVEEHTDDGVRFKQEVKNGVYDDIVIDKDTGSRLLYRKI